MTSDFPVFKRGTSASNFADDWQIYRAGLSTTIVFKNLQDDLNTLEEWCLKWSFFINPDKTKVMVFTKKKFKLSHKLEINGRQIEVVQTYKYLGITMDSKLSWKPHIFNVVDKVKKRLNILRCITKFPCCNRKSSLRVFYLNVIRSVIEYGCIFYRKANKALLGKITSCQYQCLKTISGALLGTSGAALEVINEIPPVDLWMENRMLLFSFSQLLSYKPCMFANYDSPNSLIADIKFMRPIPEWITDAVKVLRNIGHRLLIRGQTLVLRPNYFTFTFIHFDYSFLGNKSIGDDFINLFNRKIETEYADFIHVYTDGSHVDSVGSGSAFCIPRLGISRSFKLSKFSTSLLAEFFAIFQAIIFISKNAMFTNNKVVVFSDSINAIRSLEGGYSANHPLVLADALGVLVNCSVGRLTFSWLPGHRGVRGNEEADRLAREATRRGSADLMSVTQQSTDIGSSSGVSSSGLPYSKSVCHGPLSLLDCMSLQDTIFELSQVKLVLGERLRTRWQGVWDGHAGKSYHDFNKIVGDRMNLATKSRFDQVIIDRFRSANVHLNQYLMKTRRVESALCPVCGVPEDIKHFLLDCKAPDSCAVELKKLVNTEGLKIQDVLTTAKLFTVLKSQYRKRVERS